MLRVAAWMPTLLIQAGIAARALGKENRGGTRPTALTNKERGRAGHGGEEESVREERTVDGARPEPAVTAEAASWHRTKRAGGVAGAWSRRCGMWESGRGGEKWWRWRG